MVAAGLTLGAIGCATYAADGRYGRSERYRVDVQRRAYAQGYDEGREHGRDDARHARRFDYARSREFREADQGYRRSDGDRGLYRDAFRRGFRDGYNEAYRRNLDWRDDRYRN